MKLNVYSVYDSCQKAFQNPYYHDRDEVFLRMLRNTLAKGDTQFNLNPEDYSVYRLGTFDDVTGELKADKHKICDVITLIVTPEETKLEAVQ